MKQKISILGGGLAGSLLSILLSKRNYHVEIYEKRPHPDSSSSGSGRSINLALSTRGWTALERAGIAENIKKIALPMYGRMVHGIDGSSTLLPYSQEGDAIYSVGRNELNKILLQYAEQLGVNIHYEMKCTKVDFISNTIGFRNSENEYLKIQPEVCFGTDGAFSELRTEMIQHGQVDYSQSFMNYGYKEIHLSPLSNGEWAMANNALHIWPRKNFMLIALPNNDGSFTCTLFLHQTGEESFESIDTEESILDFFTKYFEDVISFIPDLAQQWIDHPVGSLVTIQCFPWHKRTSDADFCLLGDAAHAMVPFYGQGMNCCFEDCRILDELLEDAKDDKDWDWVLEKFQLMRKGNTDAITAMAAQNFIEMRDLVADPAFLQMRGMEIEIKKMYPKKWKTMYEMVSFSNIPYKEARRMGEDQRHFLLELYSNQHWKDLILTESNLSHLFYKY